MREQVLRVGIWLDPNYKPAEGGGFSYYDKLVRNIDNYNFSSKIEIIFLIEANVKPPLRKQILNISILNKYMKYDTIVQRCFPFLFKHFRKVRRIFETSYYLYFFKKKNIDVLYYLKQEECYVSNYPFIATNWDIGHVSTFPFPEIVGFYNRRKKFYDKILPKAIFVFCESEAGKEELKKYTSIDEFKLKVLPLFSGVNESLDDVGTQTDDFLNKYELEKDSYYFYPAQFWAHKNHYGLLQAFARIMIDRPNLKLVLTGSDKGNLKYIQQMVSLLNTGKNVLILGFVATEELHILYRNALALVMPTYLGATNMPPIEAMEFNCPVICSDLSGHKEILGDAALYVEPHNINSIEEKMKMIQQNDIRNELKEKLNKRNEESKFKVAYSITKLEEYLLELLCIRKTWE
jgi:glycosyltransferase involved in cell wall biosynthesis